MIDYGDQRKISFVLTEDQMNRYLRVLGQLNRSQLMRDLLMKAVREKENEINLQQKEESV
jgi:hypothetical protein